MKNKKLARTLRNIGRKGNKLSKKNAVVVSKYSREFITLL